MLQLSGNKIRLRALEPQDAEFVYSCENNTSNWQVSNTIAPMSKHTIQVYIDKDQDDIYANKQLRLIIECLNTNKTVGIIDLFDIDAFNMRAGVGILIEKREDQNKGYATEALQIISTYAFDYLKLHQLHCEINATNINSKQLFVKLGFEVVGTKKQWLKTIDGWEDVLLLQKINCNL